MPCELRLGGIAAVLETRLQQAQAEPMAPIDFLSCLISDELTRRGDRLLERRRKQAQFRNPLVTLDNFDFNFNKEMNRSLVFDLATATFIARREVALFLGPTRHRQKPSGPGHRAGGHRPGLSSDLPRGARPVNEFFFELRGGNGAPPRNLGD